MSSIIKFILSLSLLFNAGYSFANKGALTHVVSEKVCMVTNKVFPNPQIPVTVDGKKYYGCCQMCKGQLEQKPEVRMALDPVTNEAIDKSSAYIAADTKGNVYYFKNKDTFSKYAK